MTPEKLKDLQIFAKRFNCVCYRILSMEKQISSERTAELAGIIRDYNKYWQRCEFDRTTKKIHPLALMLIGVKRNKTRATTALLNLPYMGEFCQGFINRPTYRDVWLPGTSHSDDHISSSIYFNLGRAFLDKFCYIKLEYNLTPFVQQIFNELKPNA